MQGQGSSLSAPPLTAIPPTAGPVWARAVPTICITGFHPLNPLTESEGSLMDEKKEEPTGGQPESPMKFWRDNAKSMLGTSIESIESAAKQLIAVCGILEGRGWS